MIEREVCGLTMARSARSVGSPLAADDARVAQFADLGGDLVLHLDLVLVGHDDDARTACGSALAMTSSEMMSKIDGDQLRMMVWSFSSTRERPLRNSSSLLSMPARSTPIRAETTKMPPSVTTSMTRRKAQPVSPPMVPVSSVRISASQDGLDEVERLAAFGRDAESPR